MTENHLNPFATKVNYRFIWSVIDVCYVFVPQISSKEARCRSVHVSHLWRWNVKQWCLWIKTEHQLAHMNTEHWTCEHWPLNMWTLNMWTLNMWTLNTEHVNTGHVNTEHVNTEHVNTEHVNTSCLWDIYSYMTMLFFV